MDINQPLYYCDPQKNTACGKRRCAIYGGPCCITLKAEYALLDPNGNPQIVTPKQQLELRAWQSQIKLEKAHFQRRLNNETQGDSNGNSTGRF